MGAGQKLLGLAGLVTHPLAFFPTSDEWRERARNAGNTGRMGQAIAGALGDLPSLIDPQMVAGGAALAAAPLIGKMAGKVDDVADAARVSGMADNAANAKEARGMKYVLTDSKDQVTGPAFDSLEEAQAYAATQPFTKWGHKNISRVEDLGDKYALRDSWMLAGKDHPHYHKDNPDEWRQTGTGGNRRRRKPEDHK
jgi:hypothetical protein